MLEKVSIVVPVYNGEKYIDKCIQSLLKQTYKNIEIVVVNDGSTDSTQKVLDKYKERLILINQDNHGHSYSRNVGINNSTGEFVCFVDSDDYVDPNFVLCLYESIIKNNSNIAICGIKKATLDGNVFEIDTFDNIESINYIDLWKSHYEKNNGFCIIPCNKIFKRDWILANQFPVGKNFDDEFVAHYWIAKQENIGIVSEPLYEYFYRSDSQTNIALSHARCVDLVEGKIDRLVYFKKEKFPKIIYSECLNETLYYYCLVYLKRNKFDIDKSLLKKWKKQILKNCKLFKATTLKRFIGWFIFIVSTKFYIKLSNMNS